MRNIAIIIAYDGTAYCGWQVQPNGITVAQKINEAVFSLTGKRSKLYGSGRTDSGVHALNQVANFTTEFNLPVEKFPPALNAYLPDDIRVKRAYEVNEDFNARFSAHGKSYIYRIYSSRVNSPFLLNRAHWVRYPLDIDKMNAAADVLRGEHDFNSFMASGSYVKNTVRDLYGLSVVKKGSIIEIRASANGFLYNMVRIIAGTLIYAGCGKLSTSEVREILEKKNRAAGAPTMPACGLYLDKVYYTGGYEHIV